MVVLENTSRLVVCEILRPMCLALQPCHVQTHLNHLSSSFWSCSVWTLAACPNDVSPNVM